MQSWSRADQWQRAREKYSLQMGKSRQFTKLLLKIELIWVPNQLKSDFKTVFFCTICIENVPERGQRDSCVESNLTVESEKYWIKTETIQNWRIFVKEKDINCSWTPARQREQIRQHNGRNFMQCWWGRNTLDISREIIQISTKRAKEASQPSVTLLKLL